MTQMGSPLPFGAAPLPEQLLRSFRDAWAAGTAPPRLEDFLARAEAAARRDLFADLLAAEVEGRRRLGQAPAAADYLARFPDFQDLVHGLLSPDDFATVVRVGRAPASVAGHQTPAAPPDRDPSGRTSPYSDAAQEVVAGSWRPQLPGYEVLGELGSGGMSVVYKARHRRLGRLVALKMMAGAHTADQLQRFRAEAETLARLQHPNIVQVFEVGEHQGRPFFALELVEGGTLRTRLAEGPFDRREAVLLVETLARAVHHAHRHGIVHRDLKPSNILLARNPKSQNTNPKQKGAGALGWDLGFEIWDFSPKVSDFGVAKLLDTERDQTRTGAVLGTPPYMAPEQAAGLVRRVGPASDVYSLGVLLYELLTGHRPIEGESNLGTVQRVVRRKYGNCWEKYKIGCIGLVKCRLGIPEYSPLPGSKDGITYNLFHPDIIKKYKVKCFKYYNSARNYYNSLKNEAVIVAAQVDLFKPVKPNPALGANEIDPNIVPTTGSGNYATLQSGPKCGWYWEWMGTGSGRDDFNVKHCTLKPKNEQLGLPSEWKHTVYCVYTIPGK